ncbi:MAG: ABC transporter permease, partial [Thermoguttaceae bacterium]|nr:ABC transporter permease [Thermoguttaceae bacterium]
TVFLGHELGVGRKPGEKIIVAEREFRIERILPEQGSKEDISIVMHLDDAQAVLNRPGRVNQIMALGCNCAGSDLPNIRRQLAAILPDTRITEFRSIALARAEQRELVAEKHRQILAETAHSREQVQGTLETLAAVTTPVVVLASAIWVGLLALANVRERRTEIGLLRALGKGSSTIAGLLLGKAALVGLSGAAVGVLLGIGAAWLLGVEALDVAAERFAVPWTVMAYALVGAPLLSAVASYLPTVVALVQDPAIVLRDH